MVYEESTLKFLFYSLHGSPNHVNITIIPIICI